MTPAHDLVSAEYDQHKAEVLRTVRSKLTAAGIRSPDSDLDSSYNEAWHALYLTMADGEEVDNRVGYLVTVTHRRALNEFRAMKVSRRIDAEMLEDIGVELDVDSQLDAEIQLRHIREGFKTKLSPRERDAATLCHLYGYSRSEAAQAMGVRPKRMEKIMDKASGKIRSVVDTVRSGEHCDSMESTIRAFALGVLDPDGEKYELAASHLEHCSACRREVWVERGLASIGPPLPLAFAFLAGGATAGGGAAGATLLGATGKTAVPEPSAASSSAASGSSGASGGGGGGAGAGAQVPIVAAAAVGATAVVAVAAGLATGFIGGGNSNPSPASKATAAKEAAAGAGAGQAAAAAKAARAAAKKAAKQKAKRQQAALAAEAAAVVVEPPPPPPPVYTPPPPPTPPPVRPRPTPDPKPDPKPDPRPDPKPDPEPPAKPTTDAGEEFGLQ